MTKYDFSILENRENTMAVKWDKRKENFGREDILPMWVADSDWQTAPEIKKALIKRAEAGIFGYSFADQSLDQAVENWLKKRFQLNIKPEWLLFETGVVPAINFTLKAITEPGDAIIIQPPVYRPFYDAVKNNNCDLIKNELLRQNNYYKMDFENLEAEIAASKKKGKKIKALIFCSPHNPVGRVWKESELIKLLRILKRENIYLLSDEIHADIVYSGAEHLPSLKLVLERDEFEDYSKKVISYLSASKSFNIAGLHTSYTIIKSEKLRTAYQDAKTGFGTGASPFGLTALKTAYNKGQAWLEAEIEYLEANYNFLKEFTAHKMPEIKVSEAEGTYLAWLNFKDSIFENDEQLIKFMNNEAKVGLNPGRWFGDEGSMFMRLNLACPRQRLKEGLKRIERALKKGS